MESLLQTQVNQVASLEKKIDGLAAIQQIQGTRIEGIEIRVERIDRNLKGYVDNQVLKISKDIEDAKLTSSTGEISVLISNNIKECIANSAPEPLNQLKREVASIKHKVQCDHIIMESMRSVVLEVKNQLDSSAENIGNPGISVTQPNSSSAEKRDRERDLTKNAIESSAKLLKQLVMPSVDQFSDLALIKKCNMDVKKVTNYSKTCHDLLMKYIAYEGMDTSYYQSINTLLNTANKWILNVEHVYSTSEAHAISSAKGNVGAVGIFSDNADKTIYEFIEQLDLALTGWGSNTQRASELYHNHLSEDIKTKTVNISTSYLSLKEWLVSEYGSPDIIISDIISNLENKRKPPAQGKKERYQYFMQLSRGLARLDKLSRVPNIDIDDVESILYSRTTYNSLFKTLPGTDLDQFKRFMKARRLDWKKPVGIRTFLAFKEYCTNERDIAEDYRSEDPPPPPPPTQRFKSNQVHGVNINSESSSDEEIGIHSAKSSPPRFWYAPGRIFPCPISGHNHEMSRCKEFFSMHPHKRWDAAGKAKICFCCLRPRNVCKEINNCNFLSSVPEELICQGCFEYAKTKGWSPLNILMCKKSKHAPTRAPYNIIKKTFEKYMGQFSEDIEDKNIRYAVNFMHQVYSVDPSKYTSISEPTEKPTILGLETPSIDSRTGNKVPLDHKSIIPEIKEHSSYLMQTVRIGKSECLVFFDRGANTNLIKGELASKENLQQVSKKTTSLTVVGGTSIRTEYGTYRFALGPTEKGEFHEIVCQGMDSVTSNFRKQDLQEISNEYKQHVSKTDTLPLYTAGSEVHLLLGIKNTHLDPVLVTILPSGVGVYRSPFEDIWGSRLIFAGPHASFSRTHGKLNNEFSHAIFHTRNTEVFNPWNDRKVQYAIPIDKKFNITVYPTPLNEKDMIDASVSIDLETTESFDKFEPRIPESSGLEAHFCSTNKQVIPIAKMRELVNEDNSDQLVTYRCSVCAECTTCKRSPRTTAISLQEAREQDLIEASITIDQENKKVYASLPFLRNPNEFLSEKHKGKNNLRQAKSIYFSQCRKPEDEKEGMRIAHKELVDKGFMIKIQELPEEIQDMIKTAEFQHFYPWFIVKKEDSISTPIRMVVDPSCTGMNTILPKGENKMGNIVEMIIRNRVKEYVWMSDVSKLYNQLRLKESAFPFSLFLYHESLSENTNPEVYVMLRAWYGVVSTGNQAGYALDKLAELGNEEFPNARFSLVRDRYVDDIFSGSETELGRETQINEVKKLLDNAGFKLKFVVKSGEPPDEKASSDGKSTKILGYKYNPEQDVLHPGVSELNVNRKRRGMKVPNSEPVITQEDADKVLQKVKLTRRIIVSKVSEIYDPVGIWEPLKLQLKLLTADIGSRPWDEFLKPNEQSFWKEVLRRFVKFGELSAKRFACPVGSDTTKNIRLVCFSDAGKDAGGAVIYVCTRIKEGLWYSALLCSKSRLMKGTVPRNELDAILLMAELAYIAKRALGEKVNEIIYLTDSTIALCWVQNTNIKVRAFIFSRVQAIRRMIQMSTDQESIPLYHIDGKSNIADLLTKPHDIQVEELSIGSLWQDGPSWLALDSNSFPKSQYSDLTVSPIQVLDIKKECFSEPYIPTNSNMSVHRVELDHIAPNPRTKFHLLIDPVSTGWLKTLRILNIVVDFPCILKHKSQHEINHSTDCLYCIYSENPALIDFGDKAKQVLYRYETQVALASLSSKQLRKYTLKDNILYFFGRLSKDNPFRFKDLERIPFLDSTVISGPTPIMLSDSPILYSLLMYIHCKKVPHAGVEITVKEICKEVMVHGGLRRLVRRIKEDCTTCRILERKSVEIEMSNHPAARTTIAPPFFQMMIDIAYGFKGLCYKRARTSIKIYALVGVCLLTGATSILALEGLETQDIVGAIERHSSRHGVPSDIFIDNGTQLLALKHAKFSIRDIHAQVHDNLGIRVHESTAKAHSERGRVERKIRTVRSLLERTGTQTTTPMTSLNWETTFCKIASALDDLPIAKGDSSNVTNLGYEILTCNRLKLGRNNARALERGGFDIESSKIPTNILEKNKEVYTVWYQLFCDNIHMLMLRPDKWNKNGRQPVVDDIVLFVFTDGSHSKHGIVWKLGKVLNCSDKKVEILYVSKISKTGNVTKSKLSRSVRDVSIVFSVGELFINSNDHYESLHLLFNDQ